MSRDRSYLFFNIHSVDTDHSYILLFFCASSFGLSCVSCLHARSASNRMPDRIRASISLKSVRVPGLQVLPSFCRSQRTSISLLRCTLPQGEEVTPAELVSGSDGKTRGLPRPYSQSVFKTSLFSGRRPRRHLRDCRLDRFNETR